MKITRRKFISDMALLSASAAVGLSASCGRRSKKDHGELHVYNWAYYISDNAIPDFEEEFAIKVTYDNYSSNEEVLAKLQAGATGYDLIFPSDYMVGIMREEGLLAELDLSRIPNFTNIDERFRNLPFDPENTYSIPYLWGTTGIGYNSEKVEGEVTSWRELWNEKYKGRISMLDDIRGTINPALKILGYSINTTDPEQLNEAKQLLIKQKPLVNVYTSDTYVDFLKSGDIWLAHAYSGDVFQVMKELKSVKYCIPVEGTDIWVDNMCIPKGAKNKEEAELFINYLLRPEVSAGISNFTWYANPNKKSHRFIKPEILNNKSIYPDPEVLDRCEYIQDVGEATPLYEQIFNEVKSA